MHGWFLCRFNNSSEQVVRWIEEGKAYLCDPVELSNLEVSLEQAKELACRGPLSQYNEFLQMAPKQRG